MSGKTEEISCFGHGDVLESGRVIWDRTNPQGESRLFVQEEGSTDDAQRHGYRA